MSLVDNERIKLASNALNTLATASATVGVLAPSAAMFYGFSATQRSVFEVLVSLGIWISLGLGLHFGANRLLGGPKP